MFEGFIYSRSTGVAHEPINKCRSEQIIVSKAGFWQCDCLTFSFKFIFGPPAATKRRRTFVSQNVLFQVFLLTSRLKNGKGKITFGVFQKKAVLKPQNALLGTKTYFFKFFWSLPDLKKGKKKLLFGFQRKRAFWDTKTSCGNQNTRSGRQITHCRRHNASS